MPDRLTSSKLLIIINGLTTPLTLCQMVRSHVRHSDNIATTTLRTLLDRSSRPRGPDTRPTHNRLAVRAEQEALLPRVAEEPLREETPALTAIKAVEMVVLRPHNLVKKVSGELVAIGADDVGVSPGGWLDTLGVRLHSGESLGCAHLGHVVIFNS